MKLPSRSHPNIDAGATAFCKQSVLIGNERNGRVDLRRPTGEDGKRAAFADMTTPFDHLMAIVEAGWVQLCPLIDFLKNTLCLALNSVTKAAS